MRQTAASDQFDFNLGLFNMKFRVLFIALLSSQVVTAAQAQTTVTEAWVRGTVGQQMATGAFMRITSAQGGKLVSVRTPMAGTAEIHEMKMDGNTMKMRQVPALELPAGKMVELKPGGYHLMLMDLKLPMKPGALVPLTLEVMGKDGKIETLHLKVPVKPLGGGVH